MTGYREWEYLLTWFDTSDFDGMQDMLDRHGRDGWELVSFVSASPEDLLIYKRPLIERLPVFLNELDELEADGNGGGTHGLRPEGMT